MFTFRTAAEWKPGSMGLELTAAGKPPLSMTSPPEFGGTPDHWSPEDMLLGSIQSCLLLTALYVVNRMKIELKGYRSEASGNMQKTPSGLRFTSIDITITASVATAEDATKMQQAVDQAEKFCPVSAAIGAPMSVTLVTNVG
ncbi:MAG: OsmC family protein [Lentisphaerae bacterium]|nr:OsmC family protein [Lentisphaerota bacterium]